MNDLKLYKEKLINDYISSNLDFMNPNNISTLQIKNGLKQILGEEPAVRLNYRKETMLSETDGEKKRIETLESITITFTYETSIPDGNGGVINTFIPVEKEFLIG